MAQSDLDRLYGVPLDAFTKTRNEIAAALAAGGDKAAAAEIRSLKKPSIVVWTVNQLARRHAGDVERLLDAADGLRKAHRKALSAAGAGDLREATRREREVLAGLAAKAGAVLKEAGSAASRTTLLAIEETLSAAAVDEDARELLATGRLAVEMQRAGFGDVQGFTVIPGGRATRPQRPRELTPSPEQRELEREARAAEREAERMRLIAETAAANLGRLREKLADAEDAAAETHRAAAEAQSAAQEARAKADRVSKG